MEQEGAEVAEEEQAALLAEMVVLSPELVAEEGMLKATAKKNNNRCKRILSCSLRPLASGV
jgi:hypothetical protein